MTMFPPASMNRMQINAGIKVSGWRNGSGLFIHSLVVCGNYILIALLKLSGSDRGLLMRVSEDVVQGLSDPGDRGRSLP